MWLRTVEQDYLEQLVLTEELVTVTRTHSQPTALAASEDDIWSSHDRSGDLACSAAELQHCLDICPEATLLGLQPSHLRGAAATAAQAGKGEKVRY